MYLLRLSSEEGQGEQAQAWQGVEVSFPVGFGSLLGAPQEEEQRGQAQPFVLERQQEPQSWRWQRA